MGTLLLMLMLLLMQMLLLLLLQMQVSGVFLRAESNSSTPDTWHTVCSHYIHYTHPSWDLTRPGLT